MSWGGWKERNADWWEPLVAFPLLVIVALAGAIFWLPIALAGSAWYYIRR